MFVDEQEKAQFEAIDGRRSLAEICPDDPSLFQRLFEHDLVVFDATDD